jgi:hypothetical protein
MKRKSPPESNNESRSNSDSDNDTKTTESPSPTQQKNTRYNPTKEQNNKH